MKSTTLTKAIYEKGYNPTFNAIKAYLEDNQSAFDFSTSIVGYVEEWDLYDIEAKATRVLDEQNMNIRMQCFIEASIIVRESGTREKSDTKYQWFSLDTSMNLEEGFSSFVVNKLEPYYCARLEAKQMDNDLIPFMSKDTYDSKAEELLRKYYPEVLDNPMPVDPLVLAQRLNLTVYEHNIVKDATIFGRLYFADMESELYDKTTDSMQTERINGGTIVVDPDVFFLYNIGTKNNTIAHECVHWFFHYKAFVLERLFDRELTMINCKAKGGIACSTKRQAIDWIELQANEIAPRILMPKPTFIRKANEYLQNEREENDDLSDLEGIQNVISNLAVFFNVSKESVKSRMIELGFEQARSAYTYVDNHYIRPQGWSKGAIADNQTFTVSMRDAILLPYFNTTFGEKVKNGLFTYVENHFVLRDPKYVQYNSDMAPTLTDYAIHHMEECCVVFDVCIDEKSGISSCYQSKVFLNKSQACTVEKEVRYNDDEQKNLNKEIVDKRETELQENKKILNDIEKLSYRKKWDKLKDWRHMTYHQLGEALGYDDHHPVTRLIENEGRVDLKKLVELCLVLELPMVISEYMINAAGRSFPPNDEKALILKLSLSSFIGCPISAVRNKWNELGIN